MAVMDEEVRKILGLDNKIERPDVERWLVSSGVRSPEVERAFTYNLCLYILHLEERLAAQVEAAQASAAAQQSKSD